MPALSSSHTILRMQLTLPPIPGGMEQHVRRLTDEQRTLGHRVWLLFVAGSPTHADDVCAGGRWAIDRIRPQSVRSLAFFVACLPSLFRLRGSVDLVHVHGDWSIALVGWLAKRLIRARALMMSVHGGPIPSQIRARLQHHCFRKADLVHATGRRDARRLEMQLGREVLWQSSGINDVFLEPCERTVFPHPPPERKLLVVSTAILRPMKNLDLVLDVAGLMPEAQFVVIGDGPERSRLQRRIENEGLSNVLLTGRRHQWEIRGWLDQAHAFLCTSRIEGTPTAMLEAMARGVPVVTSNCGEFKGIVDGGETGKVVDGYDPRPYVDALRSIAGDGDRWLLMSRQCSGRAAAHAWPNVAATITRAMRKTLGCKVVG